MFGPKGLLIHLRRSPHVTLRIQLPTPVWWTLGVYFATSLFCGLVFFVFGSWLQKRL